MKELGGIGKKNDHTFQLRHPNHRVRVDNQEGKREMNQYSYRMKSASYDQPLSPSRERPVALDGLNRIR